MSSATIERALAQPPDIAGGLLLAAHEDQWFDRKSARIKPRALADALVAFANADGGTVVVGLSEGVVEGTDQLGDRRNALLQSAVDFTVPPVRARAELVPCVRTDGRADHLLVFDVSPSDGVVHANTRDEVFLRIGDETRRLTFAQRQELAFDRGHETYEARPIKASSVADTDHELVAAYVESVGGRDVDRVLRARGLLADGQLTVAGALLFAAHPQAWLPEAFVRVLRYRGRERGSGARQQLTRDQRFEGPLPEVIAGARRSIAELQPGRRALAASGRFEDVPLVPEDAWLEGLVNAVVHRSYSLAGDHIRVDIFDDRIEISSPGRFPGIVNLSDPLDAPRFARNPRIARVCADLDFGQELGEGIRRIYEEMRLAGLQDPIYTQTAASVRLVLSGESTDRELDAQLNPDARTISVALRDAGRLSTGEVAELLGRSRPYAIRTLKALEAAGVIRWVGKSRRDPRAHWEIVRR
jgi:ATP-dependent DNA helicase RecG